MNISRRIILPALAVIFLLWLELNAKVGMNQEVKPQKSVNSFTLTQCNEATAIDLKNSSSPKLANRACQV